MWIRCIEHPSFQSTAAFLRLAGQLSRTTHHSNMPEWSRVGHQHAFGWVRLQRMVECPGPVAGGCVARPACGPKSPHLPDGRDAGDRSRSSARLGAGLVMVVGGRSSRCTGVDDVPFYGVGETRPWRSVDRFGRGGQPAPTPITGWQWGPSAKRSLLSMSTGFAGIRFP